ncbi:hypothetical protein FHS31_002666 [Sphingomonas vulcanisoli]|uniref:Uncharacterized protein n=1 Tax=Sphingomonas vulcanisoli TaxID=1658060 RepID=A0ABX0TUB2_9SPHN|nr:DUF2585 domain-containing protein [Sphingomonas vulcanisoli]NIJ09036.1 hypothetical protein [Sphingomonas vulcanisoli]
MPHPASSLISRRHAAAVALLIAATGLIEWAEGRPPICRCGVVRLWAGTADGPETSQMLADWYSASHIIHGLLFYAALCWLLLRWPAGVRLMLAVGMEAAWELIENSPAVIARYRATTIAIGYSGDSILNSLGDIGFMVCGFLIARALPWRASVVLGVVLELAALWAIRDNLTLNVLMLVHPVEAVRVWQAGISPNAQIIFARSYD